MGFIVISIVLLLIGGTITRTLAQQDAAPTATPVHPEIAANLNELVTDENCILPCWWGFTLGETEMDEAKLVLEQAFHINISTEFTTSFYEDGINFRQNLDSLYPSIGGIVQIAEDIEEDWASAGTYFNFSKDTNRLVAASIAMDEPTFSYVDWHTVLPRYILATYGVPDEIRIYYPPSGTIGEYPDSGYSMVIRYHQIGLFALYRVRFPSDLRPVDEAGGIPICNDPEEVWSLLFLVQAEVLELPEDSEADVIISGTGGYMFEEIATLTPSQFTEALSQENNCIMTLPVEQWPSN